VGSFFALGPMHERLLPDAPQEGVGRQTDEDRADALAEFLLAGLFAA
jgi:hypothetical protein